MSLNTQKHVLVTGATGGIGRSVCQMLHGATISAVSRTPSRLEALRDDLQVPLERWNPICLDFSDVASVQQACRTLNAGMPIDGCVIIYPSIPKPTLDFPSSNDWEHALKLCYLNPLSILYAALQHASTDCRVVVVSGIASAEVFPEFRLSNAIRAAWLAEIKTLSIRLAPQGIRINTVSLGGTQTTTQLNKPSSAAPISRDIPQNIPLGVYGKASDAANLVVQLLYQLSNHITGQNILHDGGLIRRY